MKGVSALQVSPIVAQVVASVGRVEDTVTRQNVLGVRVESA
jgi:hypothetical protein